MSVEVKIPDVAESITEVTIAEWLKKDGEYVEQDEAICELETDKATQELFAESSGTLQVLVEEGETVSVGSAIAKIHENEGQSSEKKEPETQKKESSKATSSSSEQKEETATKTGEVIEMKVTEFAESISEVTIGEWLKEDGDFVEMDEPLCEIETDKATQELPAEASGTLKIVAQTGDTLAIGEVICKIEVSEAPSSQKSETQEEKSEKSSSSNGEAKTESNGKETYASGHPSPAASKILSEKGINPSEVKGTGIDGRITKEDAMKAQKSQPQTQAKTSSKPATTSPGASSQPVVSGNRHQERKRMTQLRKTIARRLVSVKNDTAMLTTFNEANMKPIMDLRKRFKEEFKEKHQVGLGFMSFFSKACAMALMEFPDVNGMIDEEAGEIIYNHYVDISVAVSTDRGLVVPVLRNVENMGFADIEKGIVDLATKAREGQLTIEDMQGGTFTITNGGIFGSMMSTPIINAPQSAILGMHNIVQRPMAVNGEVKILPMMYLALSYDHRIVDGKGAVSFLVTVKKYLEEPERLLFGV